MEFRQKSVDRVVISVMKNGNTRSFGTGLRYDPETPMLAAVSSVAPFERPILRALPRIELVNDRVTCNANVLNLATRPLTLRMFRAFIEARTHSLSRDEVVELVYPRWREAPRSTRYEASCMGNAVKLMSRCRQLAHDSLAQGDCVGLRWFPYDAETRTWSLYRLTPEFLR